MSLEDRLPFLKKINTEAPEILRKAAERVNGRSVIDVFTSFEKEDIESIVILGGKPVYDPKYTDIYMREKNLTNTTKTEGCVAFNASTGKLQFETMIMEGNNQGNIAEEDYELYDEENIEYPDEEYYTNQDEIVDIVKNKEEREEIKEKESVKILKSGNLIKHCFRSSGFDTTLMIQRINPVINFFDFFDFEDFKIIILAGGAATGNFVGMDFLDYDLFFHNCTVQQANDLIRKFNSRIDTTKYKYKSTVNENVVTFSISRLNYTYGGSNLIVQFILRIYDSISQIIHGFDIDCCCIAYDYPTETYYLTERAIYSIEQRCNTLNFEKLSPSYEHRLAKNANRGINCFIPFYELIKTGYSIGELCFEKNAGTLLKYALENLNFRYRMKKISDYSSTDKKDYISQDLEFRVENSDKQSIGTFHQIVLDNRKEWYKQQNPRLVKTEKIGKIQNLKVEFASEDEIIIGKFLKKNPGVIVFGEICKNLLDGKEGSGEIIKLAFPGSTKYKKFTLVQELIHEFIFAKMQKNFPEFMTEKNINIVMIASEINLEEFCQEEGDIWKYSYNEVPYDSNRGYEYEFANGPKTTKKIHKLMKVKKQGKISDEKFTIEMRKLQFERFLNSVSSHIPEILFYMKNDCLIEDILEQEKLMDYEKCAAYLNNDKICVTYPPELEFNIKERSHTSSYENFSISSKRYRKHRLLVTDTIQQNYMNRIFN